jgi:predicted transposase YbfD/YdcC
VEKREVSFCTAEPFSTGFPFSRIIVKIRSTRVIKKTGHQSQEERFYLSSQLWIDRTPENWINLSRSHWAGVENRNHYRRDASLGEDATRCRNPNVLANLALLRSVSLLLHSRNGSQEQWLPGKKEHLAADPDAAISLISLRL